MELGHSMAILITGQPAMYVRMRESKSFGRVLKSEKGLFAVVWATSLKIVSPIK
jgi:hypothetical protein